jgi:hypothetical protein
MVTGRTAVAAPDDLPQRRRNMPDWSSLESARAWRFRPVPVVPRHVPPDVELIERVYQWMVEQGWGQGV